MTKFMENISSQNLTHLDANGDIAMVDVSAKTATHRTATATGQVIFPADIYTAIKNADGMTKKGSITQTAYIAGVMAAKRTHELIPLCHQLPLDGVKINFDYDDDNFAITVTATAKVTHKTGVEMEALTAVAVTVMKFLSDRKVKAVALPNELVALANFNTMDEFNLALTKL